MINITASFKRDQNYTRIIEKYICVLVYYKKTLYIHVDIMRAPAVFLRFHICKPEADLIMVAVASNLCNMTNC